MNETQFIRERIRQARKEKRWSQRELADILKTTQSTISDIERGKVQVGATDLARFARVLQKPIVYFYPADLETNPGQEAELVDSFRSVPERWQQMMLNEITTLVRLHKRVQPYERVGIPEDLFSFMLWDESEKMRFEETPPSEPEEWEEVAQIRQRYNEWKKKADLQRSQQQSPPDQPT